MHGHKPIKIRSLTALVIIKLTCNLDTQSILTIQLNISMNQYSMHYNCST